MEKLFIFDSKLEKFKKPFGAITCGEKISFSAYAMMSEVKNVTLFFYSEYKREEWKTTLDWISREKQYDVLNAEVEFPDHPDIIWYHFEIEKFDGNHLYFGKNGITKERHKTFAFQQTVYSKEYRTPDWFSKGVTYHIFVDRFSRSSKFSEETNENFFRVHQRTDELPDFLPNATGVVENRDIYGGDIDGIIEKLPYLESLGVKTIYLSPIFEAWSNHKYDTANYLKVDSHFGNDSSLETLCRSAKKKGMRIILDGVFSHTGSDSLYFNKIGRYGENTGAYRDKNSPFREWYDIDEDNNYSSWWGIDTLPQVRELTPSFLKFITGEDNSVISHWMNLGISGWRLDVADELPDKFIYKLRERARARKEDSIVIGEVWEDASTKVAYGTAKRYFTEGILDGVMNYPLRNAILDFLCKRISAKAFSSSLYSLIENYPSCSLQSLMNIIGTHDTPRVINELSVGNCLDTTKDFRSRRKLTQEERSLGERRVCLASAIQYFFPGSPCIYYGDEIGMEGFEDPFNRRFFTWEAVNTDTLEFYRKLGEIKLTEECLHGSERIFFNFARGDVVIISRGKLHLAINRGEHGKVVDLRQEFRTVLKHGKVIKKHQKLFLGATSVCFFNFI